MDKKLKIMKNLIEEKERKQYDIKKYVFIFSLQQNNN